ncbi:hypothetical protein FOCC_FOCC011225 [Frankliniella occidentalis]|nr:hypothetical protein FOCC_FOCC011225 [Frankliniella occidentalis]
MMRMATGAVGSALPFGVPLATMSLIVAGVGPKRVVRRRPGQRFGVRHLQASLMALTSLVAYTLRANLSVAVVAMVRTPSPDGPGNSSSSSQGEGSAEEYGVGGARVFDWEEWQRGWLLSAFFWGYTLSQVPGGTLSHRLGGARLLKFVIISTSLFTVAFPLCAEYGGWLAVFANRVVQGVTQVSQTDGAASCTPTEAGRGLAKHISLHPAVSDGEVMAPLMLFYIVMTGVKYDGDWKKGLRFTSRRLEVRSIWQVIPNLSLFSIAGKDGGGIPQLGIQFQLKSVARAIAASPAVYTACNEIQKGLIRPHVYQHSSALNIGPHHRVQSQITRSRIPRFLN